MTSNLDHKAKHRYSPPESLDDLKNALYVFPSLPDKIKDLTQKIRLIHEEADAFRDVTSSVYNVKYDKEDGYASSSRCNKIQDPTFMKAVTVLERYDKRIAKYLNDIDLLTYLQQIISEVLESLTDDEYKIIHARYFVELSWQAISKKIHIRKASCIAIHDHALGLMVKVLKNVPNGTVGNYREPEGTHGST